MRVDRRGPYKAEVAVPFMSTGPVGWPVGEPPGGSTLIAKSCGTTRGTWSRRKRIARAWFSTPIETGGAAVPWANVQSSSERPGGTDTPSSG